MTTASRGPAEQAKGPGLLGGLCSKVTDPPCPRLPTNLDLQGESSKPSRQSHCYLASVTLAEPIYGLKYTRTVCPRRAGASLLPGTRTRDQRAWHKHRISIWWPRLRNEVGTGGSARGRRNGRGQGPGTTLAARAASEPPFLSLQRGSCGSHSLPIEKALGQRGVPPMPLLEVRTPCGWDTSPRAQRATEVLPTAPRSGFLAAKTEGLTWGHKALSTPVRDTEMTRHPQAFQVSPVSPTPAPLNPLGWGGVGDGGPRESVTLHPLGQKMGPDRHSISSRPHFLFRSLNRTWP